MTTEMVKAEILWGADTDDPRTLEAGQSLEGQFRWGLDLASGGYNITSARGACTLLDPDGVFSLTKRAAGTERTPDGRRATLLELSGNSLRISLSHALAPDSTTPLCRAAMSVQPSEDSGVSRLRLQSVSQQRLASRTQYQSAGDRPFSEEERNLSNSLAIPGKLRLDTGNVRGPASVSVSASVKSLMGEAAAWGLGLALDGREGDLTIVSMSRLEEVNFTYEPIRVSPNRPVDIGQDTDSIFAEGVITGAVVSDPTELRNTRAAYRPIRIAALGTDLYFLLRGISETSIARYNTATAVTDESLVGSVETGGLRLPDWPFARSAAYWWFAHGEDIFRVAARAGDVDRLSATGRRITDPDDTGDIDAHDDRIYRLIGNNSVVVSVLDGSTDTRLLFNFPGTMTVDATSRIAANDDGIHILDRTTGLLHSFTFGGDLFRTANAYDFYLRGTDIVDISGADRLVWFLQDVGETDRYEIFSVDFGVPIGGALQLPEPAPEWRILEPRSGELERRPNPRLVLTELQTTWIDPTRSADTPQDVDISVTRGLWPENILGLRNWQSEYAEETDGIFEAGTWPAQAQSWLNNLVDNPPEVISFTVDCTKWPPEWVYAVNDRVDVGARLSVRVGDENVLCTVVGRGIRWQLASLELQFDCIVSGTSPLFPEPVTWLGMPVEWLGQTLTWRHH